MSFFKSPLQYLGVAATNPPAVVFSPRDPTSADNGYERVTLWLNTTTPSLWSYPGSGNWLNLSSGGGGSGDVVGPASAVSGNLASYNGTTGKLIADSGTAIADLLTKAGNLAGLVSASTARTNLGLGNIATINLSTKGSLLSFSTVPAILPVGTNTFVLTANSATATGLEWVAPSSGGGDVVGPASATDNALTRFNSTTGKLIQNSVAILSDTGDLTGLQTVALAGGSGTVFSINTNLVSVSASSGFTGIGVDTALTKLHVSAYAPGTTSTIAEVIRVEALNNASAAGYGASIPFYATNDAAVSANLGELAAVYTSTVDGAEESYMKLSSVTGGSLVEVLRANPSGISTDQGSNYYQLGNACTASYSLKGDLVAGIGSSLNFGLTVGADGTVLTADSGELTGLKWSPASVGIPTIGSSSDRGLVLWNGSGGSAVLSSNITVDVNRNVSGVQTLTTLTTNPSTSTVIMGLSVGATASSGTSAGFGGLIGIEARNSGSGSPRIAALSGVYTSTTASSEASIVSLSAINAGTLAEVFRAGDLGISTDLGTNYYKMASLIKRVVVQRVTATGAFTYTPTTGTLYTIVELQAAGGGSGGTVATTGGVAVTQSAGGGAYAKFLLTAVQIGGSLSGSVGAAGVGGAAGNNNGTAGGNTTLATSSPWTCAGGDLGIGEGNGSATTAYNPGALGGAVTTGTGTILLTCAGGDAFSSLAGPSYAICGNGGSSMLGIGGAGTAASSISNAYDGVVGKGYGAGGSSALSFGTAASKAGANGTPGIAIFTEYCA